MSLEGPALPAFETACDLVERILAAADGLTSEQLDTAPWDDASTMFVLATHAISATEWNIVEVLASQKLDRSRQAEFDSTAKSLDDPQGVLTERWAGAKAAIESALAGLSDDAWAGPHYHMFMDRNLSGHELVVRALAHTAEHVGHAIRDDSPVARRPRLEVEGQMEESVPACERGPAWSQRSALRRHRLSCPHCALQCIDTEQLTRHKE